MIRTIAEKKTFSDHSDLFVVIVDHMETTLQGPQRQQLLR